jgi:hypothetical protein
VFSRSNYICFKKLPSRVQIFLGGFFGMNYEPNPYEFIKINYYQINFCLDLGWTTRTIRYDLTSMLIVGAMIANYDTYNPIHVQA